MSDIIKPTTSPVPALKNWPRIKQILDGIVAAWQTQNGRVPKLKQKHGPTFSWDTKQQLADAVGRGHRLIDPAMVGNDKGDQTNLVIALRDDDGVDSNGRMPLDGPFLPASEIAEIVQWIDAGMPD